MSEERLTDRERRITESVREDLRSMPPFTSCAWYNPELDRASMLKSDCSYTEQGLGLILFTANHPEQADQPVHVGFAVEPIKRFCRSVGILPANEEVDLRIVLDALQEQHPDKEVDVDIARELLDNLETTHIYII